MVETLRTLWQDEEAPTAVEYGIMVALIACAIIIVVGTIGTNLNTTFTAVANAVKAP